MTEFFLRSHAELLFLIDNQQTQVLKLESRTQYLMGSYQDIYPAFFQPLLDVGDFPGRAETAHIFDRTGQTFQAGLEGFEVLESQDRCRYQHSNLLGITDCLESGADGHFGLTESYVAADEAVHRAGIFHILLDGFRRPFLIGGILVHEGRFEFFLEIIVG